MNLTKKSLCVFIHFGNMEYIPKYVEIYVNELSLYFDEVIFVMNRRRLDTTLLFFISSPISPFLLKIPESFP